MSTSETELKPPMRRRRISTRHEASIPMWLSSRTRDDFDFAPLWQGDDVGGLSGLGRS